MFRLFMLAALALGLAAATPARAQGDLLVAPTRLVLGGAGGGEVIVSNTGQRTTTYRISLVLRRMDAAGQIRPVDEAEARPSEAAALDMLNYAPRKITLAPGQSQTVRIGVRAPPGLATGEYRAHLLFRAVPDAPDVPSSTAPTPTADGMSIQLTPIYGVAIPLIVRIGEVAGAAKLSAAKLEGPATAPQVTVTLGRSGARSVYGTLELREAGRAEPIAAMKGIAAYPEVDQRSVSMPIDPKRLAQAKGALSVRFVETDPAAASAAPSDVPLARTPAP
jgi:P pilus assembly chaperone PapD